MELIDKYRKEIEEDARIDELNLKDAQMKLPAIKHKWVARLIHTKNDLARLREMKDEKIEEIVERLEDEPTIEYSKATLMKMAQKHDSVKSISKKIAETTLMVTYLEKIEVIFKSMTFDIKNIVEINRQELM